MRCSQLFFSPELDAQPLLPRKKHDQDKNMWEEDSSVNWQQLLSGKNQALWLLFCLVELIEWERYKTCSAMYPVASLSYM